MNRAILAISLLVLLFYPAHGQEPLPREEQAEFFLRVRLGGGMTLDRYLYIVRSDFSRFDFDDNGVIEERDIEIHDAMASWWNQSYMSSQFLHFDIDADGVVTADEVRKRSRYDMRLSPYSWNLSDRPGAPPGDDRKLRDDSIEQEVRKFMAADVNKDGRVTWAEAIEHGKQQKSRPPVNLVPFMRQLLALSPTGKSSITLPELEAAAVAYFKAADTDGNGTVSDAERKQLGEAARRVEEERLRRNRRPR